MDKFEARQLVTTALILDHNKFRETYNYVDEKMEFAVNSFVNTGAYEFLYLRIIRNDTVVRESYYNTLKCIEDNDLVPDYMFACI
jgi:hypothetical protein